MERVLHHAGVPAEVIRLVPDIVSTCRECRAWAAPGPAPTPAIELTTKQNDQVEADLMFYKDLIVFHMIDRADRWHAGQLVSGKTWEILTEAIDTTWIQIFGPFTTLITDGETSLASGEADAYFKRRGIQHRVRAPQQHARMIERRGALLRHAMHCAESQLEAEGVTVTGKMLLAECIFAGNAMTSYNGATPFNARFGRQPALLPELCDLGETEAVGRQAHGGRDLQRIRELAIQKVVESTAQARIKRAARAQTTASGEALDYSPGDLVDFHRPPTTKDVSGWHGPAKIVASHPARGLVDIAWKGRTMSCRFADIRRFIDFAGLLNCDLSFTVCPDVHTRVVKITTQHIQRLRARRYEAYGFDAG